MKDSDRERFAEIMLGVAENFSAEISEPGMEMRYQALQNLSIDEVQAAAMEIIKSRKFTKMPTVAEFLQYTGEGSIEDKALVEAAKVLKAIKTIGPYNSVVFDDATTQAVISQVFGGWVQMCGDLTVDDEKWFQKDFAKAWAAYRRQRIELRGHMMGIAESENLSLGYDEWIEPPQIVGNASKALQISQGVGKESPAELKRLALGIGK